MNPSVVGKMDDKPMSAYQWFVIALCFLINIEAARDKCQLHGAINAKA
ncbi:hypothetical protein CTR2_R19050 [Comamonas thiooxydans]|nr:hypothetical protein [Comamonas thiooxydans]BDR08567.1 hypothetical protein CTR2_R19050 [Comamonas thiooxydans]